MKENWVEYLNRQSKDFSSNNKTSSDNSTVESMAQICVLTSQSAIQVKGPDTLKFLQGQLSCNFDKLEAMQHKSGVACTPKGRMYSSFTVINTGEIYLLKMHHGVTNAFTSNMGKYSIFYKTEISAPSQNYIFLGLTGQNITQHLAPLCEQAPDTGIVTAIDQAYLLKTDNINHCYEIWLPESSLLSLWRKLHITFTPNTESLWRELLIRAVIPEVQTEYIEKYTPQHLNLPTLGSVSFRKGCYTGQEIIARMQNLGIQKSRTYHITIEGAEIVNSGEKLNNKKGKSIGEIIESTTQIKNKHEALAIIKVDAADIGDVFLADTSNSIITVHKIPYKIDTRAELQF